MIFIDLENNPPSDDWIARADALTQQLINAPNKAARDTIIDTNQPMWSELKKHLSDLSHRKCWYSESRDDSAHCHVDHFRPKKKAVNESGDDQGGYWWLAFDWLNYRYSGPAENVRKRDYFHVNSNKALSFLDDIDMEDFRFLDPIDVEDPDKLAFTNEGKVQPKQADENHRDYIRAEYTIRRMNLNKYEIVESRKDKYRKTSNLIKSITKLLQQQRQSFSPARKIKIRSQMKDLLELASPKSEYSASVKYCLRSFGEDWAMNIVSRAA